MYYGYDDPSAAANGVGRYFGRDDPQAATNGLGAYFTPAPEALPMQGLGCTSCTGGGYYPEDAAVVAGAVTALWGLGRVLGSAVVGAAMAPSGSSRGIWMVAGAALGGFGGPIGLGALGLLAMRGRG